MRSIRAVWWVAVVVGVGACLAAQPGEPAATQTAQDVRKILGVTHVSGAYHLTNGDFLAEGAEQVLALGSRVIKLYLHKPERSYPFGIEWPKVDSQVALAKTPPFRRALGMPFKTIILTAYAMGRFEHYWTRGITPEQEADETRRFYHLAKHLLTAYRGTGKTFVLQHWEGDWAIRGSFNARVDPKPEAIRGMIRWLNARQAGVDKARAECGQRGVRVLHAAEVNRVVETMVRGRPGVVDKVLPHTKVDLVSYSAWDGQGNPNTFRRALDFIAKHTPDRPPFGARNVYVGEFGGPENEFGRPRVRRTVENVVRISLEWGCPYVVYWQVYCNEPKHRPVRKNEDVRGFWLIRPDGSKSPTWDYFRRLLAGRRQAGFQPAATPE